MQLSKLNLALTRIGKASFSPKSLFSSGAQGAWYDPSDFSTMFQDSAGTVPVTAVDQPVGLIRDKSGRGNHASQATTTKRPMLKIDGNGKYYLEFDGIDDALVTSSINFSATDKMTVVAGVRKLSDAAWKTLLELSTNWSNNAGSFAIWAPVFSNNYYYFGSRGTSVAATATTNPKFSAPTTNVVTALGDISGDSATLRLDSFYKFTSTQDQGSGTYGNYPLVIGGSFPFNGHIYSLIVVGAKCTTLQVNQAEKYTALRSGIVEKDSAYVIGDSTVASYSGTYAVSSLVGSTFDTKDIAWPGDTIAAQKTKWLETNISQANVKWVIIQIGLNDLAGGTSAQKIAELQDLVNTVRNTIGADKPLLIAKMTPCKQRLIDRYGAVNGLVSQQIWVDMNAAIAGEGATPITGVNGRITAHVPLLDDGSGNLAAAYELTNDHIHENNAGRSIVASAWRDALITANVNPY